VAAGDPPGDLDHALFLAVGRGGSPAAARDLVRAGARATYVLPSPGSVGFTTRIVAFAYQPELLGLLVGRPHPTLIDAAIDGDLEAVRGLLDRGAPIDAAEPHDRFNALTCAARLGAADVVAFLLAAGANPNPFEYAWLNPVVVALQGDHLACADLVWAAGSRADNLLYHVVAQGCPESALAWTLAHVPDSDLTLGLHTAIKRRRLGVATWLLAAGADLDGKHLSRTCLMTAAYHRDLDTVRYLLAAGIDVQGTDGQGRTAMHYAICCNEIDDPDEPFDYEPSALDHPVARALQAAGLVTPPRASRRS